MSSKSFESLLAQLCREHLSEGDAFDASSTLHSLVGTAEIRDYDWICADGRDTLYDGIWKRLLQVWANKLEVATVQLDTEELLLKVWNYAVTLPEYDHAFAGEREVLSEAFVQSLLLRLVNITTSDSFASSARSKAVATYLKRMVHWIYSVKASIRKFIRASLGKLVLRSADQIDFGSGVETQPTKKSPSSVDARDTRGHVLHLLELLHSIIAGLGVSTGEAAHFRFGRLLHDVLLPLHKPNAMVLWRDQMPVLQVYHEPLVRCVLGLVDKDAAVRKTDPPCGAKFSILVQAVHGILTSWPDKFETNTPKQVLLLHELEMLLNKATQAEFILVKQAFLDRVVHCIGTDADNIRPAQRALQMFKNPAFLALLMGTGPAAAAASPPSTACADIKDSTDTLAGAPAAAAADSLRCLMPALFRGGTLCWNPTVNKMTGLAINNLKAANEEVFASVCDILFTSSRLSPLRAATSSGSDKESARAEPVTSSDRSPPLHSTQSKTVDTGLGEGAVTSQQAGAKDSADPVLWAMQHMDLEGAAKAEEKADAKSNAAEGHFPVPTGRPGRPPALVRPPMRSTGGPTPTTATGGGLGGAAMRPFDRSNPPPVTITGVAPWAMTGQLGADRTTAMGISTTAMPGSSRAPRPFNPSSGRSHIGAPPNSLSCTIQEAKLARALAEAKTSGEEKSGQEKYSPGGEGLARILNFVQRCLPEAAPRTAEEEEAARLQDWRTVQAAVSPSLLPDLKFHDLVFGTVLGEGAFSVVKYARQILKDKTQSSWPEFAVKIIQASKIAALSYRTSVIREMAVLQLLSHPGVARLVSAFRYSDSAYMVLEYAARGDLHSYLIKHGKLEHKYCRFIVGEVVAAVNFLHESGFCYGDLKPENILITELGHIKITDFGGCRPVSEEAARLLKSSENVLETIRNGDWKEESAADAQLRRQALAGTGVETVEMMAGETEGGDAAADRLEGTPAYLPPEILTKRVRLPGFAADAWALGCVAYFCLHGRPKFFGDNDQVLTQINELAQEGQTGDNRSSTHLVTFKEGEEGGEKEGGEGLLADWEQRAADDFIDKLHNTDYSQRMSINQCSRDTYLTDGVPARHLEEVQKLRTRGSSSTGSSSLSSSSSVPAPMNPLALHAQPPVVLPVDSVRDGADLVDQQWSRRQFSVLWAPMPADYQFDGDAAQKQGGSSGSEANVASIWLMTHTYKLTPIEETDVERDSMFV